MPVAKAGFKKPAVLQIIRTVKLSKPLNDRLDAYTHEAEMTASEVLRDALELYLDIKT